MLEAKFVLGAELFCLLIFLSSNNIEDLKGYRGYFIFYNTCTSTTVFSSLIQNYFPNLN